MNKYQLSALVGEQFNNYRGVPGVYCIKIDGIVYYVGETVDIHRRLMEHARFIDKVNNGVDIGKKDGHSKYFLFSSAINSGKHITFDVLETTPTKEKKKLRQKEKKWIMFYKPAYNEDVPGKLADERGFYYNRNLRSAANRATVHKVDKLFDIRKIDKR